MEQERKAGTKRGERRRHQKPEKGLDCVEDDLPQARKELQLTRWDEGSHTLQSSPKKTSRRYIPGSIPPFIFPLLSFSLLSPSPSRDGWVGYSCTAIRSFHVRACKPALRPISCDNGRKGGLPTWRAFALPNQAVLETTGVLGSELDMVGLLESEDGCSSSMGSKSDTELRASCQSGPDSKTLTESKGQATSGGGGQSCTHR